MKIAPVKPNLIALAAAIVGIVWLCAHASLRVVEKSLPTLVGSDIADEVRASALHLLATTVGMSFASLALAGLVSWGIKLLDEREEPPPPAPTVPASTHEAVVAALTRADDRRDEDIVGRAEAAATRGDRP